MADSAESIVYAAIGALASGRVYPDVAPVGITAPYIVYQAVGGQSTNYLSNVDNLHNGRIQIAVWALDRLTTLDLMQSVIDILSAPPVRAVSIGAPVSEFEFDTRLYGSRLDFSIWWNG